MIRSPLVVAAAINLLFLAGYAAAADGAAPSAPAPSATAAAPAPVADETAMTEGPALLQRACTECHSAETVTAERKTAEGWRYTIERMVGRGATLTDAEARTLHAYLAATRGS